MKKNLIVSTLILSIVSLFTQQKLITSNTDTIVVDNQNSKTID